MFHHHHHHTCIRTFMQVPLGVLLQNENWTEDMIEILEEVH